MHTFLTRNSIMPLEQKGCSKGSYGCKDHLLLSKAIMEDCKKKKKHLHVAWIDYKKAFDSVPHSWIIQTLKMYHISPIVVKFCQEAMKSWSTFMILNSLKGTITSNKVQIKRGIFQGDSLSPLLFCMSLFPLTKELNNTACGYKLTNGSDKVNHLLYMDDLKLFGKNNDELSSLVSTVKKFSDDILMEFGLEKCAKASFVKGNMVLTSNIYIGEREEIKDLEFGDAYKYLGISEGNGIQHSAMKEKLTKEYRKRLRLILQSELNAKNKFTAIGALAVPVIQYSFGVIDWTLGDMRRMDRKTRKMLTMHGMHHPRADTERLYVPRQDGGRGLHQLESAYTIAIIGLSKYLEMSVRDKFIDMVKKHDEAKPKTKSLLALAKRFKTDLNFTEPANINKPIVEVVKDLRKEVKSEICKQLIKEWSSKPMHGKYPLSVQQPHVNRKATHAWLQRGRLKGETEALITAAQDQSLRTRSYEKRILKTGGDGLCRLCKKWEESIDHVVAGCPILAQKEYNKQT